MFRVAHPGSGSEFFTHPGSRGQKGTGSRIRVLNTHPTLPFRAHIKALLPEVLRIRVVYPGFEIFPSRIEGQKGTGFATKNLSIFNPEN